MSATSVNDGGFLASSFLPGFIDNGAGTISFVADTLIGPIPGVSGSGTLATIQFVATGAGTTPVALANIILLDSTLSDISAAVANGSVTVTSDGAVIPEPGSGVLFAVGLLGLLAVRVLHFSFSSRRPTC